MFLRYILILLGEMLTFLYTLKFVGHASVANNFECEIRSLEDFKTTANRE